MTNLLDGGIGGNDGRTRGMKQWLGERGMFSLKRKRHWRKCSGSSRIGRGNRRSSADADSGGQRRPRAGNKGEMHPRRPSQSATAFPRTDSRRQLGRQIDQQIRPSKIGKQPSADGLRNHLCESPLLHYILLLRHFSPFLKNHSGNQNQLFNCRV